MNLKAQRAAALARVAAIAKAATDESREFTDAEGTEIDELEKSITDPETGFDARIKRAEELRAKVGSLALVGGGKTGSGAGASGDLDEPDDNDNGGRRAVKGGSLAARFIAHQAYQAFKSDHPSGIGAGTPVDIKAQHIGTLADVGRKTDPAPVQVTEAHIAPIRYPTVDLTYPKPLALLDIITRGETAGAFEYLQITSDTDNASIVADAATATGTTAAAGLKPLSDIGTNIADAKVYTFADGFTVTNSMLSDAPALATFMENRLQYHLSNVVEDTILNGSGSGGVPPGVLASSPQTQAFVGDMFRTVRKGITKVTNKGGIVSAIVMSPEDDEAWDLAQDANHRYYGQGPFGSGPGTAWGRPRVVSQRVDPGTIILGDWSTVTLLDREGVNVLAFNQHADYARRNLTYIRAELRAAQAIFQPELLCVCTVDESSS